METEKIKQKWLRKEMELDQRHEDILAEREELLREHKIRLMNHENEVKHLAKNLEMARNRNNKLMEEIELFEKEIHAQRKQHGVHSELEILKERYWKMVVRELSTL